MSRHSTNATISEPPCSPIRPSSAIGRKTGEGTNFGLSFNCSTTLSHHQGPLSGSAAILARRRKPGTISKGAISSQPSGFIRAVEGPTNIALERLAGRTNTWFQKNSLTEDVLRPGEPLWRMNLPRPSPLEKLAEQWSSQRRPASATSNRKGSVRGIESLGMRQRCTPTAEESSSDSDREEKTNASTSFPVEASRRRKLNKVTTLEQEVAAVRGLEDWVPTSTELQVMAETMTGKYRTSKKTSTSFTIWDYMWEKPVVRDERILAEMRRFESEGVGGTAATERAASHMEWARNIQ